MTEAKSKTATRAAILKAAKKIFAAKGFGAATVRDICTEAGANIALVSRYFGSKSGLYAEVCRSLYDGLAAPLSHLDVGISTAEDWRNNVREWIEHSLRLVSATRSPAKEIAGVFRQEMFNPSPMRKYFRDTFLMPIFNCLRRLIEMGGSRSEAETLALMTRIWSQIAFHAMPDGEDMEGLAFDPLRGSLWISDERGPRIFKYHPRTRRLGAAVLIQCAKTPHTARSLWYNTRHAKVQDRSSSQALPRHRPRRGDWFCSA